MSVTDPVRRLAGLRRPWRIALASCGAVAITAAGVALAAQASPPSDPQMVALLKARLPKTPVSKLDCDKVDGLCEVTAGANLFYVDRHARYLIIGRVYDMETRQDLTAARLLEINPDMLVGGAARANAAGGADEEALASKGGGRVEQPAVPAGPRKLSLAGLPADGAIVWGNPTGQTLTVFTDFRCGYCRALTNVLRGLNVRVVERPISVLGSRDIANRVYCAKDRAEALHAAYAGEPVKPGAACNTSGLDANEAFAHKHGLGGTPVIVRDDGAVIEGYRPKEFLQEWLKGARS